MIIDSNYNAILSPQELSLQQWVAGHLSRSIDDLSFTPLQGDAGQRRYYRLCDKQKSYIAVYDSSVKQIQQFIHIHRLLSEANVRIPAIITQKSHFFLLEDLGDKTYWSILPQNSDLLYEQAWKMLIRLQKASFHLPTYSIQLLSEETQLFEDWYIGRYLNTTLSEKNKKIIQKSAQYLHQQMTTPPLVPVHRDYHSRNLMFLNQSNSPGVLDFQDAVIGSPSYDIVSLLRDAYVKLDICYQNILLKKYFDNALNENIPLPSSFDEFYQLFNIAGVQRGLKVLGIFSRLAFRDGKVNYLNDLYNVYHHLMTAVDELPPLKELSILLKDHPPQLNYKMEF